MHTNTNPPHSNPPVPSKIDTFTRRFMPLSNPRMVVGPTQAISNPTLSHPPRSPLTAFM
jgi:hypothetical protein